MQLERLIEASGVQAQRDRAQLARVFVFEIEGGGHMPRASASPAAMSALRLNSTTSPPPAPSGARCPLKHVHMTWGDEVLRHSVDADLEPDARAEMAVGELGYWPPGNAFCISSVRRPPATGDAPVAASPVNVLGRVIGDATMFRAVRAGDRDTD